MHERKKSSNKTKHSHTHTHTYTCWSAVFCSVYSGLVHPGGHQPRGGAGESASQQHLDDVCHGIRLHRAPHGPPVDSHEYPRDRGMGQIGQGVRPTTVQLWCVYRRQYGTAVSQLVYGQPSQPQLVTSSRTTTQQREEAWSAFEFAQDGCSDRGE